MGNPHSSYPHITWFGSRWQFLERRNDSEQSEEGSEAEEEGLREEVVKTWLREAQYWQHYEERIAMHDI